MQRKWESTTAFLSRTNAQTRLLSASATNGASVIIQVVNVMLIVAGVYLIQERLLTMGGLIAVTMLGGRAMGPLGQAVGMLMQFQNARMSLETLEKLMAQPVDVRMPRLSFIARNCRERSSFATFHSVIQGRGSRRCRRFRCTLYPANMWWLPGRTGSGKPPCRS